MLSAILVDDEVVAVSAVKRLVPWKNFDIENVYTANSMEQAKVVFENHHIDLMLCDIEMPQGSGLDLLEWVKSNFPKVECIFLTCHPEFSYIKRAMQLGSLDYILKPIDYDELNVVMKKVALEIKKNKKLEKLSSYSKVWVDEESFDDDTKEKNTSESVVSQVKEFIKNNLGEELTVEKLAEVVFLNPQYLMRLFKKETGKSILEYITEKKIALAKELLVKSEMSTSRISDKLGYSNYSYFIKIFRREVGKTPKEYRDEHKDR
jgi:YesN/AraC family two-component response regulator